ncbi:MAG: undecaprenyl-diphosphate phosphatase [Pseudomonadota bacterium]
MDLFQIILLAFIQGITEFLPISSSGHLALTPVLLGVEDQGLSFDIAVHIGSLLAVIIYFRHEVVAITTDTLRWFFTRQEATENSHLGYAITIATIPIVLAGGVYTLSGVEFRGPVIIAVTSILFGLLLWWADTKPRPHKSIEQIRLNDALIIGIFQILSIIPGTSRSGITMTAALMLGFTRTAASKFSFLLAIPTILMSAGVVILKIIKSDVPLDWQAMVIGAFLSFIFAYMAIFYFLKLIERVGMLPFIIYRVLLGILLLVMFL